MANKIVLQKDIIVQLSFYIFAVFITSCGLFAIVPFLAIYIKNNITDNITIIGFILGSFGVFGAIGGVLSGIYINKYSIKKIMLLMVILICLVYIAYYLGSARYITFLFIGSSLIGFSAGVYETCSKIYIASQFDNSLKAFAFIARYNAMNIGATIGPFIGAFLITYKDNIFLFAFVAYLISGVIVLFFFKDDKKNNEGHKQFNIKDIYTILVNYKSLRYFTIITFIYTAIISQMDISLPLLLNEKFSNGAFILATLLSINSIMVVTLSIPIGLIISKIKPHYVAYMCYVMYGISMLGFAFSSNFYHFIIAMIIMTLGEIMYAISNNLILDVISTPNMRGMFFGINSLSRLGKTVGAIFCGFILEHFNSLTLYIIVSIVAFTAIFIQYQIQQVLINKEINNEPIQ